MKCQKCEKPASFHITELTGPEPRELHLCEDHARDYLTTVDPGESTESVSGVAGVLAQQLQVGQTAEELARLDQRACPVCGITFYEFRNGGRLGCPNDYNCFAKELEPLIVNIHGESVHKGKRPRRAAAGNELQTELIQLRREMQEAIDREDYEDASRLRDRIAEIERENPESGD